MMTGIIQPECATRFNFTANGRASIYSGLVTKDVVHAVHLMKTVPEKPKHTQLYPTRISHPSSCLLTHLLLLLLRPPLPLLLQEIPLLLRTHTLQPVIPHLLFLLLRLQPPLIRLLLITSLPYLLLLLFPRGLDLASHFWAEVRLFC